MAIVRFRERCFRDMQNRALDYRRRVMHLLVRLGSDKNFDDASFNVWSHWFTILDRAEARLYKKKCEPAPQLNTVKVERYDPGVRRCGLKDLKQRVNIIPAELVGGTYEERLRNWTNQYHQDLANDPFR